MKLSEFRKNLNSLDLAGLAGKLNELRRELFSLKLNTSTTHVKDYSQLKKTRKNIARILTLIGQKNVDK